MATTYYYIVHVDTDPDSPVLLEGVYGYISKKLLLHNNNLYRTFHFNDGILDGEYYVERIPIAEYNALKVKERRAKKRKTKFDNQISDIELMLDVHKNTIIFKNHDKVIERLNQDGYYVKETHEPKRVINGKGLCTKRKYVYDECWILELIRKDEIKDV